MKVFGVAILIMRAGMVLSIARRNNHNDWGLPGGKVDPGESPAEAAAREFKEETGYVLLNPRVIFTRMAGSDLAETYTGDIEGNSSDLCFPLQNQEGEPPLSWKIPNELIHCPTFGQYNFNLFKHLGIKIN